MQTNKTMEAKKVSSSIETENKHEEWFASFISQINNKIKTDKENLESGNAPKETIAFYNSLIAGDTVKALGLSRSTTSNALIQHIIVYYLNVLKEKKIPLSKLALDISANKVLAWAEIKDNDEASEMELIRVESIVNAKFAHETGINLDSIIVESCDKLPIPSHYQSVGIS